MPHYDEVQEPRREAAQDYYAGYYWSMILITKFKSKRNCNCIYISI
jgi:hypothetical protein